ncbi:MAG TPA: hypothetical protein VLA99_07225 [Nitrospiraceae bacterium]|nr:hypothetical protein [Nitrospiraceae bacterium]
MTSLLQHPYRSRGLLAATALFCIGILCLGAAAQTLGMPIAFWDLESDYDSSESLFEDVLGSPRDVVVAGPMARLRVQDMGTIPLLLLDHSLFRPPSPLPLS